MKEKIKHWLAGTFNPGRKPGFGEDTWRQQAIQDFSRWLTQFPGEEQPPEFAEAGCGFGLADIVDAVTALQSETAALARNAGKIIRDNEELQKVAATEREQAARTLASIQKQIREDIAERDRSARAHVLSSLFDLTEDLTHIARRCEERKSIKTGFFHTERIPADLLEDISLLVRRSTEMLHEHGIEPVAHIGDLFDPHCMRAVGITEEGAVPPGCVSDIVYQGILHGGQALRHANVKVEKEAEDTNTSTCQD